MTIDLDAALATIAQSPRGKKTAAFFDFDGTIIDGYSALAVLQHRARHLQIGVGEAARVTWSTLGYLTGRGFEGLMETAVKELNGTKVEDLDKLGRRLLKETLGGSLFPGSWEIVHAHKARGHRVVIASSAMPFQVEPLAAELGVDDILCTRLEIKDGAATGRVDGEILWGRGKANAVTAYAAEHGLDLDDCYGYANGDEDIDFLSTVGRPTCINPGKELFAHAEANGWPTLRFGGRQRPGIEAAARTVAAYSSMVASFGVGLGIGGVLNRSRKQAVDLSMGIGSDVALSLAGIDLRLVGEEHLTEVRPAVFVFNHQSLLDPLVAMKLIRHDVTAVGKKEVARQPGLAQFAKLANAALVDRADSKQAREALRPIVDRLKEGYSIIIAPEGTRSTTPRLGTFKKGAFHVAMQAGVPIVPIVFRNTGELLWRGSTVIRPGTLDVAVLPPISTDGWTAETMGEHVKDVRDRFVATLDDWPSAT